MYDTTEAVRFIRSHESFVILGHKEPDGDCVASQMTFAALLRALGKEATLHSAGPFDRPEISPFEGEFARTVSEGPPFGGGRDPGLLDAGSHREPRRDGDGHAGSRHRPPFRRRALR